MAEILLFFSLSFMHFTQIGSYCTEHHIRNVFRIYKKKLFQYNSGLSVNAAKDRLQLNNHFNGTVIHTINTK